MSTPTPTPHAEEAFVCACEPWWRAACTDEPFYKEHEGKPYCVLHYPGTEKKEEFDVAFWRKLENQDFNFRGVWFPDPVYFRGRNFSTDADFTYAHFNASTDFSMAYFEAKASFRAAQFKGQADFSEAQFSLNADFADAQFKERTEFSEVRFDAEANFSNAQFKVLTYFMETRFHAPSSFSGAQFEMVFFNKAQFNSLADFLHARFGEETNFINIRFKAEVNFNFAQFGAETDFSTAQFEQTAYFSDAQFSAACNFKDARFCKSAYFDGVAFIATGSFQRTEFSGDSLDAQSANNDEAATDTGRAIIDENEPLMVSFAGAKFTEGVSFEESVFAEHLLVTFDAATFEKPERAVFHSTRLRPHWFINIDSRKLTFIDVDWGELHKQDAIHKEISALESSGFGELSRLLYITFQQLAVNAEENNRYETAADFRYMAMDVKRLQRGRKLDLLRLSWWYWLLSGYGERVTRAFGALLAIWLFFAVVYWSGDATWWQPKQSAKVAAESNEPKQQAAAARLTFAESLIYSAGVLTLQKPEPSPANKRAKAAVLFETILGPLQAALLALAIRRKFMR